MTAGIRRAVRRAWLSMFPHHPYEYLGRVALFDPLVRRLPRSYVEDVERGVFTGRGGLIGALVRGELERRYYGSTPDDQARRMRALWGGDAGRAWHAHKQSLYNDPEWFTREFLSKREPLVRALADLVARDARFHTICELGTGNGLFLELLSQRLPTVGRFVGIDLSEAQTAANRQAFAGTNLEFESAEALDWIAHEGRPGTIVIACGTLECLPAPELKILVDRVAAVCRPAAFGLVEPVNIDLDTETESRPRGAMTFSHNYPALFRASGYEIAQLSRIPIDPRVPHYEMVVQLAVATR